MVNLVMGQFINVLSGALLSGPGDLGPNFMSEVSKYS